MNKKLEKLLRPNNVVQYIMLFLFSLVSVLTKQYLLAAIEIVITVFLFVLFVTHRKYRRKTVDAYVAGRLSETIGVKNAQSPFPMAVIRMDDGGIVHVNDSFVSLTGYHDVFNEHNITEFLPDFKVDWLFAGKMECPRDVRFDNKRYKVYGSMLRSDENAAVMLAVLYFVDLTNLFLVYDEYIRSRPVVSIILIDNYDDLTRNLSEAAVSAMDAKLNNTIMRWVQQYHGLLRRLEKNRFLLIFENRDLKRAVESKFSILEEINRVVSPSGIEATISMGLGLDGATFEEGFQFASLSLEMALSRGGDQAVVKDRNHFDFYGGRTKESDQRSNVRSRVVANTLMEMLGQCSKVFIMGHKNADLDSVGAAMGVACLCRKKNKPFHIVLDMEANSSQSLLRVVEKVPAYANAFMDPKKSIYECDPNSILVVVDTNNPNQVESKELLEYFNRRICVIDHHLRAASYIADPWINFHETNASSASELVTELLEYSLESKDILPIEAMALMAGIYLDTKNFNLRTGERTFAAASYLRQLGVDTIAVKMLFQSDFESTKIRHQIVQSVQRHTHGTAIAVYNGATTRPIAAQAADEILNIVGIVTSFVLYKNENTVFVSGRTIGDANVQKILEVFHGGGNAASAGAQIEGMSLEEVAQMIKNEIDNFYAK